MGRTKANVFPLPVGADTQISLGQNRDLLECCLMRNGMSSLWTENRQDGCENALQYNITIPRIGKIIMVHYYYGCGILSSLFLDFQWFSTSGNTKNWEMSFRRREMGSVSNLLHHRSTFSEFYRSLNQITWEEIGDFIPSQKFLEIGIQLCQVFNLTVQIFQVNRYDCRFCQPIW